MVTTEVFLAGTNIGHDPGPAETTYPVTAGRTSVAGVQRTTTPFVPIYEVTVRGAFGKEYVAACAVGTSTETSSDDAKASVPQLKIFFDVRVFFIAAC
jgi:hypothetical protein